MLWAAADVLLIERSAEVRAIGTNHPRNENRDICWDEGWESI